MFYDKEEIDELLKCPNCSERLEEPCTLPCGHAVCAQCTSPSNRHWFILPIVDTENELERRSARQLVCNASLEVHCIPAAGFPLNQVLLKLLKTKPTSSKPPPQHAAAAAAVQLAREQCVAHMDKCFERLVLEIGGGGGGIQAKHEQVVAAASDSATASLAVDFECMQRLELSGVFGAGSSFMRIICCRSPKQLVAFYRKNDNVYLSMAKIKSSSISVWSENGMVVLAASDCFTCQHDAHILVYLNMASKGKASLKLYDAAHLRLVASSISFVHRAVSVAMNARALYVATTRKQIVTFDNKRLVVDKTSAACCWPSAIEHMGATDQLLVVVDASHHVTTLNCADLGQQMRVFSILECHAPCLSFHIHSDKYLLVYKPSCRDKLRVYDFEGNKSERQMRNVPPNASLVLAGDLDQRLVFVDSASSTLYFY